jgi:hypothetical protein
MAITLRSQKGSPLTFEEMDGNFTTLSGNTQYADTFKSLVSGVFDDGIPTSAMTFNYGTEELEGIFEFDSSIFFDNIDLEDYEAFKGPILREEGNYIVYYGTKFLITEPDATTIMLDGIIVAQGGDLSGPGKYNKGIDYSGDVITVFSEEIEGSYINQKYVYQLSEGEHNHILTQDLLAYGGDLTNIVLTVADDAVAWSGVTITTKQLTTI